MTYTLHKLQKGFIITSDEEIKSEDLFLDIRLKSIFKCHSISNNVQSGLNGGQYHPKYESFKVITQQNQIDFSALTEKEQKEIGWIDITPFIDKQFEKYWDKEDGTKMTGDEITAEMMASILVEQASYIAGFKKAQELLSDRKFTLNEVKGLLFKVGNAVRYKGVNYSTYLNYKNVAEEVNKITQFLSQPKSWKVELEMEFNQCDGCRANYPLKGNIHIVSYPSGQMVCQKSKYNKPKFTNGKVKILKILS